MDVMPALARPLAMRPWTPYVGQASPPPPAPAGPSLFSINGPVWALGVDVTIIVSSATLAMGFGAYRSRWSSVFWGLTAVAGFKAFLDLSRIYR